MNPKTTGAFITALRKERDLTQKQLAEQLQITDKAISRWETGKGYPDIESLMALSEVFEVSVNELLCGERIASDSQAQSAEREIADAYLRTDVKKRRLYVWIVVLVLVAVLLMVGAYVVFGSFYASLKESYSSLMGSDDCVIASDHSYMMLYGERYVPLTLDEGVFCESDTLLVKEAKVEGATLADKLLFGSRVYTVKGCEDLGLVYVYSETGKFNPERVYCVQSRYEEFRLMRTDPFDWWIAKHDGLGYSAELTLSDELIAELTNDDAAPREKLSYDDVMGVNRRGVYALQENGPFRRVIGELIRDGMVYYWVDEEDFFWMDYDNGSPNGYTYAQVVDAAFTEELAQLFADTAG